jgi:hypothetical protein
MACGSEVWRRCCDEARRVPEEVEWNWRALRSSAPLLLSTIPAVFSRHAQRRVALVINHCCCQQSVLAASTVFWSLPLSSCRTVNTVRDVQTRACNNGLRYHHPGSTGNSFLCYLSLSLLFPCMCRPLNLSLFYFVSFLHLILFQFISFCFHFLFYLLRCFFIYFCLFLYFSFICFSLLFHSTIAFPLFLFLSSLSLRWLMKASHIHREWCNMTVERRLAEKPDLLEDDPAQCTTQGA